MKNQIIHQILVGLLLLGLAGCKKEGDMTVVFQMKNNTNTEIVKAQVVSLTPASSQVLLDKSAIEQGGTYEQAVQIKNLPKSDGEYELQLTQPGRSRTFRFGYFTNGTDLNKTYSLDITKDTVTVKTVLRDL